MPYSKEAKMKLSDRINMRCPSCNGHAIFIGKGGYLTCSYVDCPEPDIAKKVALLEAKLTAIECGDCHKTMLECKCDD